MTSRVFFVALLLTGCGAAQTDIDVSPSGPAALEKRFNSAASVSPANGLVTVSELSIPAKARKEFDKGLDALRKGDLKQAARHLSEAIVIYPAFPGAYNNLGVVYARLGDTECERASLQKAIALNDHFELAYLNWARMSLASSDYANADTALGKVANLDPGDPTALVLLAYSEFMQGHLPKAIAASARAHALGKPHVFAHRVAARAFEQQQQFDRAIGELTSYLKEDPSGPLSDSVRRELEIVQALPR